MTPKPLKERENRAMREKLTIDRHDGTVHPNGC